MRNIDFDQVIRSLHGEPLSFGEETLTLKFAVVTALLNTYPGEQIDGAEKARRYRLARAIHEGNPNGVPVSGPESELIKSLIGKTFGPAVVGPIFDLLDEANPPTEQTARAAEAAGLEALPKKKRSRV